MAPRTGTSLLLLLLFVLALGHGVVDATEVLCCDPAGYANGDNCFLADTCIKSSYFKDFPSVRLQCGNTDGNDTISLYVDDACTEPVAQPESLTLVCGAPKCANACSFRPSATKNEFIQGMICIVLGLLTCFFGYRLFKIELFIAGFVFGGGLSYVILKTYTGLVTWEIALICVLVGLVAGVIVIALFYIGIFLIGFVFGALIVIVILHVTHETAWAMENHAILFGMIGGAGCLFGVITIIYSRVLIIIATSFNGAYAFARGLDMLTDNSRLQEDLLVSLKVHSPSVYSQLCWQSYVILSTMCFFILAGLIVQFKYTAKNYDHKKQNKPVVLQMTNITHHHHHNERDRSTRAAAAKSTRRRWPEHNNDDDYYDYDDDADEELLNYV